MSPGIKASGRSDVFFILLSSRVNDNVIMATADMSD
jgi:hypothetical protein